MEKKRVPSTKIDEGSWIKTKLSAWLHRTKVRSLECSSQLRSQRQLDDRHATQKQCVELTQHSARQIETSQTSLQAKWDEALITTVPQEIHELTIDVRGSRRARVAVASKTSATNQFDQNYRVSLKNVPPFI